MGIVNNIEGRMLPDAMYTQEMRTVEVTKKLLKERDKEEKERENKANKRS